MEEWLRQTAEFLRDNHGLAGSFSDRVALFLAYCYQYRLAPIVTSGFRDPKHQAELRARWDRGDRAGIRVRPAADSQHSTTAWGKPAARAIDITTKDDRKAAQIARALGLGAGLDFKVPDLGHYFEKG